jgi:predicted amidohydrolase
LGYSGYSKSARGIPIMIYSGKSVKEMDELADRLMQEGLITPYR